MVKLGQSFMLWFYENTGDIKTLETVILEILSSGSADPETQKWIAERLNPDGKTKFKADFSYRRGHSASRDQQRKEFLSKLSDLYYALNCDEKEFIAKLHDDVSDGGFGLAKSTAYQWLKEFKKYDE